MAQWLTGIGDWAHQTWCSTCVKRKIPFAAPSPGNTIVPRATIQHKMHLGWGEHKTPRDNNEANRWWETRLHWHHGRTFHGDAAVDHLNDFPTTRLQTGRTCRVMDKLVPPCRTTLQAKQWIAKLPTINHWASLLTWVEINIISNNHGCLINCTSLL